MRPANAAGACWPHWVPEPPITPCTCWWWPETAGIDTAVPLTAVAQAVETLYEKEIDGDVDLDAFHDGTAAAYRLLEARNADPSLVLAEALRLHAGEPSIMLIAMAVSLAGEKARPCWGRRSARCRPCTRVLISRRSTRRWLRAATTSHGERPSDIWARWVRRATERMAMAGQIE
jgi:hypothetical protein